MKVLVFYLGGASWAERVRRGEARQGGTGSHVRSCVVTDRHSR